MKKLFIQPEMRVIRYESNHLMQGTQIDLWKDPDTGEIGETDDEGEAWAPSRRGIFGENATSAW